MRRDNRRLIDVYGSKPHEPADSKSHGRTRDNKLAFNAHFYLNRSVSADDRGTSLTGVEPATAGQNGGAAFATTHWSVVLAAQSESPTADEALEKLCRTYWQPLYSFVRRQGLGQEDAQDLVQEFFARLLKRQNVKTIRREKGRLRSYLLVSLKRFLVSERNRASGVKRYQTGPSIPLDELLACEGTDVDLVETLSPDMLYERRWALAMLDQVLTRLESEHRAAGNGMLFQRLKDSLIGEEHGRLQAEIATELEMTENAVKQAYHRLRCRYRLLLREEIAFTVAQSDDVEDELRHFISVLRG